MVAVKGVVAVPEGLSTAGAIVWWRLSGPADWHRLTVALASFSAAGAEPSLPSPTVALSRAVAEQRGPRRLVRPLAGHAGWSVLDEVATEAKVTHNELATFRLDDLGRVVSQTDYVGSGINTVIQEVRAAYERHLDQLSPDDVGAWLVSRVKAHDATPLRDTGGIYFVPAHALPGWRALAEALRSSTAHVVFEIPALRTDEAVSAVLEALSREAEAEAEAIEAEMADLGARALDARVARVRSMAQKVARYENLLGAGAEDLRGRLERLQANLSEAALAASADEH